MKKKDRENIKLKTITELEKLLKDSEDLLFKLRLEKVQNKLKNQRQIFMERKKAAFVLTLLNDREREKKVKEVSKPKEKKEVSADAKAMADKKENAKA